MLEASARKHSGCCSATACGEKTSPQEGSRARWCRVPRLARRAGTATCLAPLRPITLLESTRKILSSILTRRLKPAIEQHGVLRGLNLGFRQNRQAADLAFAIQGLCEASRMAGRPLDLLSLDVRRAYDSV